MKDELVSAFLENARQRSTTLNVVDHNLQPPPLCSSLLPCCYHPLKALKKVCNCFLTVFLTTSMHF